MGSRDSLTFPKKSHRKPIRIPRRSVYLAEFIGIMLGDGGINNPWQATISMNAVSDRAYSRYVSNLGTKLFGVVPAVRKRMTRQTLIVSFAGMNMVDFLVEAGLPRGNKLTSGVKIPDWIMGNATFQVPCVRGLVDTDGCIYIHRHRTKGIYYENIGLCFTSYAPNLIAQVGKILAANGITPYFSNKGRAIYVYEAAAVKRYLDIFGTSNERISSVFNGWERKRKARRDVAY